MVIILRVVFELFETFPKCVSENPLLQNRGFLFDKKDNRRGREHNIVRERFDARTNQMCV